MGGSAKEIRLCVVVVVVVSIVLSAPESRSRTRRWGRRGADCPRLLRDWWPCLALVSPGPGLCTPADGRARRTTACDDDVLCTPTRRTGACFPGMGVSSPVAETERSGRTGLLPAARRSWRTCRRNGIGGIPVTSAAHGTRQGDAATQVQRSGRPFLHPVCPA